MRECGVAGCDLLRREYIDPAGDDECARQRRAERCASSPRCLLRWLLELGQESLQALSDELGTALASDSE